MEGPGGKIKARALIDPGSTISLSTNRMAATVKAEKIKRTTNMSGLKSSLLPGSKYTISLKLSSVYDSFKTASLKAALLEGITAELPAAEISGVKELPCFQGFQLADSAFNKPGRVKLLLDLDVYSRIQLSGKILDPDNHLYVSQSIFGWTIGGTVNSPAIHLVYNTRTTIFDLGDGVRRFWNHLKFHVLLQKGSKQLINLTLPIPGTLMASIQSLFQVKYQVSNLAVPEIRLSDIFYKLKEFSNATVPGTS